MIPSSGPGGNGTYLANSTTSPGQTEALAFDPAQHLRILEDGSEYLDARWRLVWFLETHREYNIASSLVHLSAKLVIVKVTITLPGGRSAEGLGMASAHDVYRYVETAQTHALARALAMLGFGTESALEFDTDTPADSGVQRNGQGPKGEPTSAMQLSDRPEAIPEPAEKTQQTEPRAQRPSQGLPSWASLEETGANNTQTNASGTAPNGNRQPAQASPAEPGLRCQECQGPVKEGRTRQGKILSPSEVAERAREQTGRVLCPRCLTQQLAKVQTGGRSRA